MRRHLVLILVVACTPPAKKKVVPDAEPAPFDAEVPAAMTAPPSLPPVEGATADAGKALFAKYCVRCHGAEAKGDGPDAPSLSIAPTDLTKPFFLCHSTIGTPALPSDVDVESALDRGYHATGLPALDPAQRRSLTLYVKSLTKELSSLPPDLVASVPAETPDDDASKKRGRTLFLAVGCWKCHGTGGAGDGMAAQTLGWNGKSFAKLPPLGGKDALWFCGKKPDEIFRAILLGVGDRPRVMPGYDQTTLLLSSPRQSDEGVYSKPLIGKVSEPDRLAVEAFFAKLPTWPEVQKMPLDQRRARQAGWIWDLVHYVESL